MLRLILLVCMALTLSACAGAIPWNKQNNAGLSDVRVDWTEVEQADGQGQGTAVTGFRVIDGKERGAVSFEVEFSDGTVLNYASTDEKAFEGQALRADIEKVIAEQIGEVGPGVVDAILKAATGGDS